MTPLRLVLLIALGLSSISIGAAVIRSTPDRTVARMQVQVLNGCGEVGLAQRAAHRLQALGQDVVDVGDAEHHEFERSFLIDLRGKPKLSRRLAELAGPCQLILARVDESRADVSLVLGKDWRSLELFADLSK